MQPSNESFRSSLILSCFLLSMVALCTARTHCYPDLPCWPTLQEKADFYFSLDGHVAFPTSAEYDKIAVMKNIRKTMSPYQIVVAMSTADVQKSIKFARQHNLKVAIQSSGHDYEGRSTCDECLQIYLGNMSSIQVNPAKTPRSQYGEATMQSGAQWLHVYEEVDKHNRVIIGGSAHTVSMGGYTQGGGHSPMSRMFGLAVDNLLEIEMVDVNGSIVIANATDTYIDEDGDGIFQNLNNADLFWAVRGGGGGTWGVVTKFTFKLHPAAKQVVNFLCEFRGANHDGTVVATPIMEKIFDYLMHRMPRQWGGYFITNASPNADGTYGTISLFLNHYGEWNTTTRLSMDEIKNFQKDAQRYCIYKNYTSFLEYERTAHDAPYYWTYVTNILISNFTSEFVQEYSSIIASPVLNLTSPASTGTLIGGKMMEVDEHETSVHPGFRQGLMALTTGIGWSGNGLHENEFAVEGRKMNDRLRKYGYGMYRNEGAADSPVWKDDFWGSNYPRLEQIKRRWDPDNFFTCVDCVGKDL